VKSYDNPDNGGKPTKSAGNAGGRPILPILAGVAAVIALIAGTIALSKNAQKTDATVPSTRRQVARDSGSDVSNTATGQGANTGRTAPPGPAVAPITPRSGEAGSRPEPNVNTTTPEEVGSGRNIVAPPGPAANQSQRTNP
ncbi:MAG: hypothetical protein H7Y38_04015, partial [Armatimonadetes bacterium]|nr:hypothetical protein [Armatimonadota bacterium]